VQANQEAKQMMECSDEFFESLDFLLLFWQWKK